MLNNSWFKKEKPFVGFAGFGGGVLGLQFFSTIHARPFLPQRTSGLDT